MKILTVDKIRAGDAFTIRHEPIADLDLMERAATACFNWLIKNIPPEKKIRVFCGTGNNGGDGLVIARLMGALGYPVTVYLCGSEEKFTSNSRTNFDRLKQNPAVAIHFITTPENLPILNKETDVVIDALIGSGLTKPASGLISEVIGFLSGTGAVTVSIDIPSGLFSDQSMAAFQKPPVVHADYTLTFSPLKLAFVFPENDPYIGRWTSLDIGISKAYTDSVETGNYFVEEEDIRPLIRTRNMYSHKGNYGHALLICGSTGKMGAAILSTRASLRSGAGLVSVHIPAGGNIILQTSVPEAMVSLDVHADHFSTPPDCSSFTAVAIGPGIGQSAETTAALKLLIQNSTIPMIFDADAINILGENKTWISFIPKGSIFTPHPKEFERMVGKTTNHFERNQVQRDFSVKHGVYIILKGAHSAVTTPDGSCFFNSTGNPGMATGGSGDVLTGILAGLKAQGYSSLETCLLGTYIHGLAGDLAAAETSQEALIAGDIVDHLGSAFRVLQGS